MKRLRLYFTLFFLFLSLPVILLLARSYDNLSTEAMLSYKERAEWMLRVLDERIYGDLVIEENRSHLDYRFIKAVSVIGGEEITLSPLATYPLESHYEGLLGYFQVDPDGSFHSPMVPEGLLARLPIGNRQSRMAIRNRLEEIIESMKISTAGITQRVSARKLEHLLGKELLEKKSPRGSKDLKRLLRGERIFRRRYEQSSEKGSIVFDVESEKGKPQLSSPDSLDSPGGRMEVALDPFQVSFNSEYLVFHRNVWRNGRRFMQGYIVSLPIYFSSLVRKDLKIANNDPVYLLKVSYKGKALFSPKNRGENKDTREVLRSRLSYPLNRLEIIIDSRKQEKLPGASLVIFLGVLIEVLLIGGLFGIYKVTAAQMRISRKRGDFISSVTHELKTPLTAIRMYGELLMNSWVISEEKKQRYYQLIARESERLSRLIQNVLDLSRLEKNQWKVNLIPSNPEILLQAFVERFRPAMQHAGFELEKKIEACEMDLDLDEDACMQIFLNIGENSLKFARESNVKKIELKLVHTPDDIVISLRDFGPGIPTDELDRIFDDFYRIESEMTRHTAGTGIGLSLVRRLSSAMNVKVEARNASPGLIILLHFPRMTL